MATEISGLPHWELEFDADGRRAGAGEFGDPFTEVPARGVTDLFVMSHGWNNSRPTARRLYRGFLGRIAQVAAARGAGDGARIGTVGIIWPSMRWADEDLPVPAEGGMASLGPAAPNDAQLARDLRAVYREPEQVAAIDRLAGLLDETPRSDQALEEFRAALAPLVGGTDAGGREDQGEAGILDAGDTEALFDRFAGLDQRVQPSEGTLLGLGDRFQKLWKGGREVLRATTYFEMKRRAGAVGKAGLGPALQRLRQATPGLRVHLIGHSFGARLVSFALAGLPAQATGENSPVKSLLLVQAAFSQFAFARRLPHDPDRAGALARMEARVDGPLAATFSVFDTAVGQQYPLASIVSRDDAAAFEDQLFRWGAIGARGFKEVGAAETAVAPTGRPYQWKAGGFTNLNANNVIRTGRPPSGAHSDILHDELAWAALSAAGLPGRG